MTWACEGSINSRDTCSAICRPKSGWRKIIRYSGAGDDRRDSARDVGGFRPHVCAAWPSVDSAGEAAADTLVAVALLAAKRAAADGRDRLQRPVRRLIGMNLDDSGVGCDHVHEESGSTAGSRCGKGVPEACCRAGAERGTDLRRALHGGRNAAGSMGQPHQIHRSGTARERVRFIRDLRHVACW